MTLFQKLEKFRKTPDVVLFRWVSRNRRVSGDYAYLGDVRLETVTTDGNSVIFSSAAPVFVLRTGRPTIEFSDTDVVTVLSGDRKNLNVFSSWVREDEEMVPAPNCFSRELKGSVCPSSIEKKLLKICGSTAASVCRIIEPMFYRLTKNPEGLCPVYGKELKEAIEAEQNDDLYELHQKFLDSLEVLGNYTESGYIIPFEFIAKGGCIVVNVKGIPYRQGSQVMSISKRLFRMQCFQKGYDIMGVTDEQHMGGSAD